MGEGMGKTIKISNNRIEEWEREANQRKQMERKWEKEWGKYQHYKQ